MKNYKIAVAGTGYVGLSLSVLLAQHNQVMAVDIVQAKVDMINNHMPENIPENYIFFYQLEDDDFKMAKWCKALAEEKGLQIVYIYEKKSTYLKRKSMPMA